VKTEEDRRIIYQEKKKRNYYLIKGTKELQDVYFCKEKHKSTLSPDIPRMLRIRGTSFCVDCA
jgi:hypothetical protein